MTDPSTKAREIAEKCHWLKIKQTTTTGQEAKDIKSMENWISTALMEYGADLKHQLNECGRYAKEQYAGYEIKIKEADAQGYRRGCLEEAERCGNHGEKEYRRGVKETQSHEHLWQKRFFDEGYQKGIKEAAKSMDSIYDGTGKEVWAEAALVIRALASRDKGEK